MQGVEDAKNTIVVIDAAGCLGGWRVRISGEHRNQREAARANLETGEATARDQKASGRIAGGKSTKRAIIRRAGSNC